MSPNVQGALLMLASMASFTFSDVVVKVIDDALPLMQILLLRGLLTMVLIVVLARMLGQMSFRLPRKEWGFVALRSACEVGAAFFFLNALLNMPLANVVAILQSLPLTVSLGAALIYREVLGWRRLSAIFVGFVGVMLIVRPGAEGFSIWSIYAVLAVFCVTARDLSTRRIGSDVPSMTVTLAAAVAVTMFAAVGSLTVEMRPMTTQLAMLIVLSAVFVFGGYYFSVRVMRVGDIGFIAPFRYSALVFALILGYVVFGDWPDAVTLLGAAIVVGTGLFTLYRARRLSRLAED